MSVTLKSITILSDLWNCNYIILYEKYSNEWYVRDSSRKVRAVLKAKAERGERLGTRAPYGYKKDEADSKKLVVDEEAAAIVRRIFAMCAAGSGPSQIARKLSEEQILCPTTYAYQKFGVGHVSLNLEKPCHWMDSTIANMLENELYLGNTINMRFSSKSHKDKRKVEHPREECLVFERTHPALVTQEVWNIVQRVRQNRRRPTKMNEQNKYSGLVVCADCGATMVLHRAHTMKPTWNNFTCRTYKKEGAEVCTAHYIRECVLDEVILEDLRRVTAMAREHTRESAEYIGSRQSAEIQQEIRRQERELTAMRKRGAELDAIFKKLYEDRVLGHISVEQFQTLSGGYTEEQTKLANEISRKRNGYPETAGYGFQHRWFHRQGQAVHGYHGADTGVAATVHPENCGTREKHEVVEKGYADHRNPLQRHRLHWWGSPAEQGKPPAGDFSIIPAGVLPRVVDTPVRGRPYVSRLFLRKIDHMNGQALAWCDKVNGNVHATTNEIPFERLKKEGLNPLTREYIIDKINLRRVQKDCLIPCVDDFGKDQPGQRSGFGLERRGNFALLAMPERAWRVERSLSRRGCQSSAL